MEVGTVAPKGSPWADQLQRYKAEVQERTNGRLKVKLRLGRGNERSLARRVQMGSMQAFAGSVGGMSSIVREVNVIETPYLFESFAEADKALDNPEVARAGQEGPFEAWAGLRNLVGERIPVVLQQAEDP